MRAPFLAGKKLVLISILRAGNGLLEGMLDLVPSARVGHVGLYRDPQTLEAVEYYFKVPEDLSDRPVIVLDPMLATGNSTIAAVERIKHANARRIKVLCLLSAPEGLRGLPRRPPGRPSLHRRHRRKAGRPRLYRSGHRGCRRPPVRDQVTLPETGYRRRRTGLSLEVSGAEPIERCPAAMHRGFKVVARGNRASRPVKAGLVPGIHAAHEARGGELRDVRKDCADRSPHAVR